MRSPDLNAAVAMLCVEHHLLSAAAARALIADREMSDSDAVRALTGYSSEPKILAALAGPLGVEFVNLTSTENRWVPAQDIAESTDMRRLVERSALPVRNQDTDELAVMLSNPRADADTVAYLQSTLGVPFRVVLGMHTQIQAELIKFDSAGYDSDAAIAKDEERRAKAAKAKEKEKDGAIQVNDSPVVAWIDNLLARASAENASDVHFMTNADGSLLVRFRIDGHLRVQPMPLRGREGEVVGTLLSRCPTIDPSDKTRPQDGAFSFSAVGGRQIDTRLAMLPQVHGPLVVIRLLDPMNVKRRLDSMGFAPETLATMREVTAQPQGLVLVIGPTGSGKTTTLYSLMNELDALGKHILTAEDPVEYRLPNIGQTQIRNDLGDKSLTFARALRAFLRLDPDIILVGEIRDADTADVSMHAALTGHLVLSTIHANSALGVFRRLEELGGEPFLVAEALSLAVSQRLIARVHDCREMVPVTPSHRAFLTRMGLEPVELVAKPVGCHACGGTGYRGRIPVMEVLKPSEEVRELVATHAPSSQIMAAAKREGWSSIFTDAYRHVSAGESTVEEMLRVLDTGKGDA